MEVVFSRLARELFARGASEVHRLGHAHFGEHHILWSILAMSEGAASAALDALQVDRAAVQSWLEASYPAGPASPDRGEVPYDETGIAVVDRVLTQARDSGRKNVSTGHVLLAALETEGGATQRALSEAHVPIDRLIATLRANPEDPPPSAPDEWGD